MEVARHITPVLALNNSVRSGAKGLVDTLRPTPTWFICFLNYHRHVYDSLYSESQRSTTNSNLP